MAVGEEPSPLINMALDLWHCNIADKLIGYYSFRQPYRWFFSSLVLNETLKTLKKP